MNRSLLYSVLEQKILPAITFHSANDALPVAEAILLGGLRVMEIQFRSAVAVESIRLIRKHFPEMQLGAGTLLTIQQMEEAIAAGAQFGLSPGYNPLVCDYAQKNNFPFVPGVMTPSEIEQAAEKNFNILKLFPAAQLGGAAFLRALESPYEQLNLKFIPMGGVTPANRLEYLKLKNVIAVGGSWIASGELISAKQFHQITKNTKEALMDLS